LPVVGSRSIHHTSIDDIRLAMAPLQGVLERPLAKIRVLLADDHAAILAEVRLELAGDFDIVGMVANGCDAIDAVLRLNPDVLVTDISMPILDGLQVARSLRTANSITKIAFLTVHAGPDFVAAALSTGALGYVAKRRLSTDLIPAIRGVLAGDIFVSRTATP
jgi:DNA-binding NarL/FixJ family response regulator